MLQNQMKQNINFLLKNVKKFSWKPEKSKSRYQTFK